jgi:rubrerythrin
MPNVPMPKQPIYDDGVYRCPVCGERCDVDLLDIEGSASCPYCGWPEEEKIDEELTE